MHKGAVHGGMATLPEGLPALVVGSLDDLRAEPPHGVDLGCRRSLYSEDLAGHPSLTRGEGHSLPRVACAHGPDAPAALIRRQQAHSVVRPTNLERPDRLKVLEFQINLRRRLVIAQTHERRAYCCFVNVPARVLDHREGNGSSLAFCSAGWDCFYGHGRPFLLNTNVIFTGRMRSMSFMPAPELE